MTHPVNTEWRFPLDESRKDESLSLIRQEASEKIIRRCPGFPEYIWNQLRFKSWQEWLTQGGLLLAALLLALWLRRERIEDLEMLAACSVFFVFAGNICLSQVARLFSWHMAELELSFLTLGTAEPGYSFHISFAQQLPFRFHLSTFRKYSINLSKKSLRFLTSAS